MKWNRIALIIVTLSLLAVPLAWSQGGNAEQQVKKVVNEVNAAILKADANAYGKLLSDDYSIGSAKTSSLLNDTAPTTFLVAPSLPLGYAPSSVATGDLRRSGKLDLVTADYNSGNVTVFLGTGNGNFASGTMYAAGAHPSSVLVADINGDGRPDVLVCNGSAGTISVLLGNGNGTLQPLRSYALGFNPSFIATGTFNTSGKTDIVAAGQSRQLAVLLNDGDGNLQKPVLLSLRKTPTALTVADFNNDGHADLALANTDGTVSVLLGKGAGLFRSLPDISVASGSLSSINSGDLNKDGKIDLVVTQFGQKLVSVLIGRGDGTFASPASYPVGNEPVSTLVADVNGDGVPALVVINKSSNTFSILGGNGDGTFKTSADFVAGNAPLAAVAGDFYGNGHVDLAIINHSSQTVSVPPGNGDGTFKAARSYPSGVQPVSIASGNLSGGKIPALVVANYCGSDPTCSTAGNVAVFLADDKGVYGLSSTYTVGSGPVSVALADLTGDKNLDIVALNRLDKTASVLLALGDGTFRQPMTFPLAGSPVAVAVGDVNKDGRPDLAVLEDCGTAKCTEPGSVEILTGTGDGSFQSLLSYAVGYSPSSLAIGDISGDKNLDIVVANRCGADASCQSPGSASVLLGDGTGKFTAGTDIALGNSPASIALGNLTGSGLDLVVSRSTDNTVAVLHGNGDGTFQAAVPYPVGNNPGSLVVADFNGDGKADVAVANVNDATVSTLYGRGDGTLQPATTLTVGSGPASLVAVGSAASRHASLATANGNSESSAAGTEFSVLSNLGSDPPLTSFVVSSGTNPSSVNAGVLLTATLTGVAPNAAPSGTVTFDSGGTFLSDCVDVSITQGISPSLISRATCTTRLLTAGAADFLTAVYSGDMIYDPGVGEISPAVTQTVNQLSPTLTLSPSSPSSVNGLVTFTATLGGVTITPIGPTATISFTTNGTAISCNSPATVDSTTGVATCPTSALIAGTDVIGASYPGDTNFKTATAATINQTVNPLAATLGLTGSPGTSVAVGTSVTFTAQLSGTLTPVVPSGTVTFTINGSPSSNCPAVNVSAAGAATCTTSSLVVPADVITATYSGDPNFTVANPATITETVGKTAAKTALKSSLSPSSVNQTVTFTATVTPPSGTVLPTGTVTFTQGATTLCGATGISSATGIATCSYAFSSVTAGTTITATYSGDQNFSAGAPATVTQVVAAASTTTSVVSSPNPSAFSQSVTFTATVIPTPDGGTVTFTSGSTTLCSGVALASGVATCVYSALPPGSDVVTAHYGGDTNFAPSFPDGTYTQIVNGEAQTITFANPGAQTVGTPLTLTATASSGLTVTFTSTTSSVCTVSGTTATFIASGTCTIDAIQAGNSTYGAATMVPQSFTVNAPGFTIAVAPNTLTITAGQTGTALITVTPVNGFASAISFTCSDLPSGATCSAPSVTPNGIPASLQSTLTISTTSASAAARPYSNPLFPGATLAVALCCFPGFRKRRALQMFALLTVSVIGLSLFTGCGGSSTSSVSTITVTGTSSSLTASTTIQLTVKQ